VTSFDLECGEHAPIAAMRAALARKERRDCGMALF
jgi:hypothetical protein